MQFADASDQSFRHRIESTQHIRNHAVADVDQPAQLAFAYSSNAAVIGKYNFVDGLPIARD